MCSKVAIVMCVFSCRISFQTSRRQGDDDLVGVAQKGRCGRGQPSIMASLTRAFGFTFFVGGVLKFFQDLLGFASPQILKYREII